MAKWIEPRKSPKATVDVIIEDGNRIVLLNRAIEPFKGKLDLIGGHIDYGELAEHASIREAKEETGLKIKLKAVLGVYSDKKRDPRFHTITTAFIAEPVGSRKLKESLEGQPTWADIDKINFKDLGFDHEKILKDYLKWRKKKGTYWSTK